MGGHLSIVKASYSYFTRKMEKVGRIPLGVTPPRRRFFDDSNLLLDQPVTVTFFLFVLTYLYNELYVEEMDFLNQIPLAFRL